MNDKFRNRLNAMYSMRLALSKAELRFQNLVTKKFFVLRYSLFFHLCLLLLSLDGSQPRSYLAGDEGGSNFY